MSRAWGVEIHLVDVDSGGGCLSRCGDQQARSSYETGDEKGANAHREPPSLTVYRLQTAKGIRTSSLAQTVSPTCAIEQNPVRRCASTLALTPMLLSLLM